jgi:hypothetical protein
MLAAGALALAAGTPAQQAEVALLRQGAVPEGFRADLVTREWTADELGKENWQPPAPLEDSLSAWLAGGTSGLPAGDPTLAMDASVASAHGWLRLSVTRMQAQRMFRDGKPLPALEGLTSHFYVQHGDSSRWLSYDERSKTLDIESQPGMGYSALTPNDVHRPVDQFLRFTLLTSAITEDSEWKDVSSPGWKQCDTKSGVVSCRLKDSGQESWSFWQTDSEGSVVYRWELLRDDNGQVERLVAAFYGLSVPARAGQLPPEPEARPLTADDDFSLGLVEFRNRAPETSTMKQFFPQPAMDFQRLSPMGSNGWVIMEPRRWLGMALHDIPGVLAGSKADFDSFLASMKPSSAPPTAERPRAVPDRVQWANRLPWIVGTAGILLLAAAVGLARRR